jgi:hypothetical protein
MRVKETMGEVSRYRKRGNERERVGEGREGEGEKARERGRCDFLVPLHNKSGTY